MRVRYLVVIMICVLCVGCQTVFAPKIGMAKEQWLHRTLIADLVAAEGNWEVWKSGNTFYYFKDGKLERIDQGQFMQQRFQIEVIHR